MPAAAGDGLLGEPAAGGGGAGADAARGASCLPAWVSGVPRERLRDFQHHKRVGPYLVGSRKLGEGSFAKVREGLHVLTGEKVSGRRAGRGRGRGVGPRAAGSRLRGPARPRPVFPLGRESESPPRAGQAAGLGPPPKGGPESVWGWGSPGKPPAAPLLWEGAAWRTRARLGGSAPGLRG